jgi:serine/threonine protein kinase
MIGQTISHYKIIEKLGEGGMGIVYKAHDINLDRTVALKFLPHHLTSTANEQSRFLQEAKAAAALNHPNICTIHGIEEAEGKTFIIMEYIDGKTLREKIGDGKLQIADSVGYAIQIGDALAEAHSKGIVHRDIKSENIMLNPKNQIKVMDFGLAKLKGSLKITKSSSTIGTLAYMAPEQIQGGEVDARSDVFSFGVVLYEMLTGHLPFRGEHEAAVMYSIVNEEPVPIQKYLPDVSSEMQHILNRALEKDPEERYQTIHDMVIDLRRLKKETGRVVRPSEGLKEQTTIPMESKKKPSKRLLAIIAIGLTAIVTMAILLILPSNSLQINPKLNSYTLNLPFRSINGAQMSLDGKWVVFPATDELGNYDVYLMNLSDKQYRRITFDSAFKIQNAVISPDVSTILYTRWNLSKSEIVSVSTSSGEKRIIIEDTVMIFKFFPDGKRIQYMKWSRWRGNYQSIECWVAQADGSGRQFQFADSLNTFGFFSYYYSFDFSPDGKKVVWTKNFPGYTELMVHDLEKGTNLQLTHDKKHADDARWTSTGHIIYTSNRGGNSNLWVIPGEGGEPMQLTRGGGADHVLGIRQDDKRILYCEEQEYVAQINIGNLADGSVRQLTIEEWQRTSPRISPSKKKIVFAQQEIDLANWVYNIYIMDTEGKNIRRITSDNSTKYSPSWSPDEKWITYRSFLTSETSDSSRVYLIQADGSGKPRLIGYGLFPWWFNEKEFVFLRNRVTYKGSIDKEGTERFSDDSLFVIPILKEKYVLIRDYHAARSGWWITSMSSYKSSGTKEAKLLINNVVDWWLSNRDFYYTVFSNKKYELRRISLPGGKEVPVKHKFPTMAEFSISDDGRDIVFIERYTKTKFIIIDNPFK